MLDDYEKKAIDIIENPTIKPSITKTKPERPVSEYKTIKPKPLKRYLEPIKTEIEDPMNVKPYNIEN
jgi:hypothetical protein